MFMSPGAPNPMMAALGGDPLDELGRIERSLRFRLSASAYISRTPAVVGNLTAWTWSGWVKLCKPGQVQTIFGAGNGASNQNARYTQLQVDANGALVMIEFWGDLVGGPSGGVVGRKVSSALFRDAAAWYHIVAVYDSNNATATSRMRIYVNGVEITSYSSYTALTAGFTSAVNQTTMLHTHGGLSFSGMSNYADIALAGVCFVDGAVLSPASFGQSHPVTRQWRPKAKGAIKSVADAGGVNSFFLPFEDTTSTATLCADASAKGNNWSSSGISLTTDATYDSLADTPTTNYCTLSPLMPGVSSVGTISNAALTFSYGPSSIAGRQIATFSFNSFKAYYEANLTSLSIGASGNNVHAFGFSALTDSTTRVEYGYMSDGATMRHSLRFLLAGSQVGRVNVDTVAPISSDVLAIAFDSENGVATAYKNGIQVAQLAGISTSIADWTPHVMRDGTTNGATWHFNYGQRPFFTTPPAGFKSLCAKNLPRPAGAALKPWEHFDTLLYSGTGAARDVTSVGLSPDYVMGKDRSAARDFFNYSRQRGVTKYLAANLSSAEQTLANGLTAFLANGFTVGSDANSNANAESFVAWLFNAGGAAVANNSGSIASQVAANQAAGISVVTYAGNGVAGATIGHGLGKAPKLIIIKNRLGVGTAEWLVGHDALGWTDNLILNSQGARTTALSRWNNTAPTSTVFTVGSIPNAAGETYEALCIAEIPGFSKVFSHAGNGSADGPLDYFGFLPAFTLLKNASSVYDWYIHDAKRSPYNGSMPELYPSGNSVEGSGSGRELDYVSTGLKVRNANAGHNASGSLYVGLAFAAAPFRYANAR